VSVSAWWVCFLVLLPASERVAKSEFELNMFQLLCRTTH